MQASASPYILAIDLGTSGPKVALVSALGQMVASEKETTELLLRPNGGAEQRPDDWWAAITRATRRLLRKQAVSPEEVIAVGCTTQWSGTVAVNREGQPLMNAIIWMDSRGARQVKQIVGGPIRIEGYGLNKLLTWVRLTGGIPARSGKDSIAHILYIQDQRPDIYRATYKFLEPKDYLNLRLTGRFAASYDSISLHWLTDNRDINHITYHPRLFRMAGIEMDKLPELKQAVDILGPVKREVAAELGISGEAQVVMGTPDMHSAGIGAGAVDDYHGHLYIGTSSWLTCHVPFKKTDVLHNLGALPSAIPGRYFVANEQEAAGACLSFLKDTLFGSGTAEDDDSVYETLDRLAESAPAGSQRAIFTPWLNGERTPVDDRLARGGFHNLSLQHTRADLVRAVFEGVAYNSRWLHHYVEKFIKRPMEVIHMVGGGASSDVWCQIHADVLNRTIRQVKAPVQATARGVAFLASVALGYLDFSDVPERVEIAQTYEPNPAHRSLYDALFREYLEIYRRNRPVYARLNRSAWP